ncbi:hypothetical protein ONS95_011974 [Cadophora gregata]|uniref:uncharacterized protein n=1 Tax=Cadophora gregata TaxID=51156 RepID=UPI0026DC8960|nr:uncharacterized protein ONS95_011974 [Cadophora gregata]KAK0117642.1 hypothetical protein ONS95_011974 [Cadophora gregata]KAK0122692.1 hypothetical protein ONS96_009727 [Cadophora gregata f. sp. sojae]
MPAPNQFYPRASGPHRIACIALYRSLLEQSLRVPLPAKLLNDAVAGDGRTGFGKVNPIKHFIQKKFRQNVHHSSPRLIVPALKAGYAAEELLHAASTGNTKALTQIHDLLDTLHQQRLAAQKSCTQPPPRPTAAMKARLRAYPNAPKVADVRPLPLPKLSGNRHVPTLTVATYLPFLRFKKGQSPYLSRVLNQKVRQRQKRVDWLNDLEADAEVGALEEEWEWNVLEVAAEEGNLEVFDGLEREGWGAGGGGGNENEYEVGDERWDSAPARAKWLVQKQSRREFQRAGELADKLAGVVEKERELWERERRERKQAKREAKRFEKGDGERRSKRGGEGEKRLEDWEKEVEAW